ncbi:MAG TPA: chemotaxis response regulator protein-glutamate methylesterase [Candidatus Baltobacteraceae bacterium]|nr:chemotaxis response regulator protein-glutamate methylesterase [Candidatus Baltobacteraceae bacterium]
MAINVLVVDDSAFMRRAISRMLEGEPDIIVCGTARNGEEAVIKAGHLHPDVITMDVEMPGMSGLDAVREIMSRAQIPIIMVSALTQEGAETTFRALDLGAVDFIAKPDAAYVNIKDVARDLVAKVRVFARRGTRGHVGARPKVALPPLAEPLPPRTVHTDLFECVAIGTSTGGPVALSNLVPLLPATFSTPIVIVQHMPPGFTRPLADRLNQSSQITVVEGAEGMVLRAGQAIIAPAGRQLVVRRVRGSDEVEVQLCMDEANSLHVPSVDVMAASVADVFGASTLAAILTGMGQDGVVGLRKVKDRGGFVIGQDAATSVVYGMPRAAAQAGLVDRVLPLDQIAPALCELTNTSFARS